MTGLPNGTLWFMGLFVSKWDFKLKIDLERIQKKFGIFILKLK